MRTRPAAPADVDRLVEIHFRAFPDPRPEEPRRRRFVANPLGSLADAWVAEDDGVVLGHAFAFSLGAWFGGRRVPVTGIASVGVAPEARGRGVATALLARVHEVARARGDALCILHAFRDAFYVRHGYGKAGGYRRLRIAPASVPRGWAALGVVRAARAEDRPAIEAVYARSLGRRTGAVERPPGLWTDRFADPTLAYLVAEAGGVCGYVAFELVQAEPHASVSARVDEIVADDPEAERALWGRLGGLRDQVDVIAIDVADDDPIAFALDDPDRHTRGDGTLEHPIGVLAAGPMLRIVDRARALFARGYSTDGAVRLVGDGGVVELAVVSGRAGPAAVPPADTLEIDDAALAAVAFGGLPLAGAERLGLARASSPAALARASELFRLPAYLSRDPF